MAVVVQAHAVDNDNQGGNGGYGGGGGGGGITINRVIGTVPHINYPSGSNGSAEAMAAAGKVHASVVEVVKAPRIWRGWRRRWQQRRMPEK